MTTEEVLNDRDLGAFLTEIKQQYRVCRWAYDGLVDLLNSGDDLSEKQRFEWNTEVWARTQLLLTGVGIIYNILWPGKRPLGPGSKTSVRERQDRGDLVRGVLRIPGGRPLFARAVRNALEHIDERLDDWIRANPNGQLLGWQVERGIRSAVYAPPAGAFRALGAVNAPGNNRLVLFVGGEGVELIAVMDWLMMIEARNPVEPTTKLKRHVD